MKACTVCGDVYTGPGGAHPSCILAARPAFDTRLATYAVIVRDDCILLAHVRNGHWSLPGGGVDLHEDTESGAVREVREETGYDVVLGTLLGVRTEVFPGATRYHRSDFDLKAVQVMYEASVTGGTLTHETDNSTDEACWFPLSALPVDRMPSVDWAIARATTATGVSR